MSVNSVELKKRELAERILESTNFEAARVESYVENIDEFLDLVELEKEEIEGIMKEEVQRRMAQAKQIQIGVFMDIWDEEEMIWLLDAFEKPALRKLLNVALEHVDRFSALDDEINEAVTDRILDRAQELYDPDALPSPVTESATERVN